MCGCRGGVGGHRSSWRGREGEGESGTWILREKVKREGKSEKRKERESREKRKEREVEKKQRGKVGE